MVEEFIELCDLEGNIEIQLITDILNAHEIPFQTKNKGLSSTFPIPGNLNRCIILVPKIYFQSAKELIQNFEKSISNSNSKRDTKADWETSEEKIIAGLKKIRKFRRHLFILNLVFGVVAFSGFIFLEEKGYVLIFVIFFVLINGIFHVQSQFTRCPRCYQFFQKTGTKYFRERCGYCDIPLDWKEKSA